MIPTFYQIKLGNTTAYARSHNNAVQFQNDKLKQYFYLPNKTNKEITNTYPRLGPSK